MAGGHTSCPDVRALTVSLTFEFSFRLNRLSPAAFFVQNITRNTICIPCFFVNWLYDLSLLLFLNKTGLNEQKKIPPANQNIFLLAAFGSSLPMSLMYFPQWKIPLEDDKASC